MKAEIIWPRKTLQSCPQICVCWGPDFKSSRHIKGPLWCRLRPFSQGEDAWQINMFLHSDLTTRAHWFNPWSQIHTQDGGMNTENHSLLLSAVFFWTLWLFHFRLNVRVITWNQSASGEEPLPAMDGVDVRRPVREAAVRLKEVGTETAITSVISELGSRFHWLKSKELHGRLF